MDKMKFNHNQQGYSLLALAVSERVWCPPTISTSGVSQQISLSTEQTSSQYSPTININNPTDQTAQCTL
eukprot:10127449-Ditylum_brightwellii.AAC.1